MSHDKRRRVSTVSLVCILSTLCSDAQTDPYTQIFQNVAAGTYTFRLTAINDNNPAATAVSGASAVTSDVIVGLPGQPRLASAVGAVGKATIEWLAPISDPNPGACMGFACSQRCWHDHGMLSG